MVDADGRDGGARVPTAAFSRLSATNVLFGWTWPQIGVGLAGLVMVVGGAAAGMVLPLMLAGGVVMAYGLIRYEGLSLMAWTYVWLAWRRRVRDGSTRWSASPLASGRPAGVLGVWGQVGSRAQVVEGSGVEVVGTPFHGACYLFDPERRRATAVLALKVEEWTLSTDASKSSRAAALNDLTARLADTPGVVELKETALLLPGAAPAPDLPDDGGSPEWMRRDMAELWALPEVMTPWANVSYVSVTCDVDRLKGVDHARGRLTERERVGVALGDLVKMTVAPALVECGARPGSVRWCGLDDLRTLIRSVSDPAGNADRPPVTRDEPTLGWCEESLDGESVTLESCVARTWWVTQWPDRPVPAGWTRDILQGGRMIALTHIWRPMSMEKSEKDLRDRESSILQRDTLQNQRKLSRDERRERREQRQREAEQDANWPDTDHQGYITLFAPDRDMLAVFERDLRVRVGKYHLRLSGLRGQQRQALTAVLPLGL